MTPVEVHQGASPLVLGLPHTGTHVPEEIYATLNGVGRALADTDWHVDRLYDGLHPDATVVRATFHRYVIDANRDPAGESLYPGQNTTGLCPLTDFDGRQIYRENQAPDATEIERRRRAFHAPYHAVLARELDRVHRRHGFAVLYDCHSIRSHIPFLFDGELPVLNIGTNNGETCHSAIEQAAMEFATSSPFATVLNARFKGGWTTRHYGRPDEGLHAIQMEIAQRAYLAEEKPPWCYDAAKANRLRPWLRDILLAISDDPTSLLAELST
ncbi:MAG: N-formylglutamate deformylase [Pseudomonadota bacterium]